MNDILAGNKSFLKDCLFTKGCILFAFFILCLWTEPTLAKSQNSKEKISLDFVDTPIDDVARAVSLAYDTPILVDQGLHLKVTFHLDGVGLLEGVTALCSANGLELVKDGGVFHIRKAVARGEHEFSRNDSLISVSVREKDVGEFIREFAANTGLNILASPSLGGRISGTLRNVPPQQAFRNLMKAHGFRVWEEDGCLRVDSARVSANVRSRPANSVGASSPLVYRDGELFSLVASGTNLSEVLQALSETAGLNLALYGDVRETVHVNVEKVPLSDLLEILFMERRYSYSIDGNVLRVSEGGSRKALSQTKLVPLKHVNCEKAMGYFTKFMPSETFAITEIREQNGLLLGGSPAEIKMAEDFLNLVDVPALQVTLSCIVVELKRGKNFEIGVHSGASRKTGAYNVGARGYFDFLSSDFSTSGAFGKIGLLPDRFEIELASMEENNMGSVLARPRLTTLNGNKAELNVTNTVYYLVSQVSADGYPITDYRSFNDGISLEMTPSVTMDGNITLEVSPEIKTAGRSSGDGPRDISTRNLKTVVVLKDGETLCLGGLIRKNKSEVRSAVPFLGSIPVIGRLFSYTSEVEEENELAIFITPRVERKAHDVP